MLGERLRVLGWTMFLGGAVVVLTASGGSLAPPPVLRPDRWGDWAAQRDPLVTGFAVLRLGAAILAWYLLAVTVLGVVARVVAAGRLVTAADAVTIPAVRRLLHAAWSVGLTAATLTTVPHPAVAAAAPVTEGRVVMRSVDGVPADDRPVIMRRIPGPSPSPESVAPAAPTEPTPSEAATWTVETGDHFWRIAERTLERRSGASPSEREVARYWRGLVEANRDRLAARGNPDLVFRGQVFVLPD